MAAFYAVITETLHKIGLSLVAQFSTPSAWSLQDKGGDESALIALAWCEAIGLAE